MYITNQRYFVFILFIFLLVFSMNDITDALPVCDRTTQVRDGIVTAAGVDDCSDVTDAHLAAIITLNLKSKGIETLKNGDFDGLSALKFLNLSSNDLSSLPSGILDNQTALKGLYLGSNQLLSLPSGIFNNQTALTSLYLTSNDLSSLPSGIFDNLTALTDLSLGSNDLSSLPSGIFNKLTTLTSLSLGSNDLSSLPSGIFDNLTALTTLYLGSNRISSLPSGIFTNLTALEKLYLNNNEVSPLPLTVSLEKVAEGQFKATVPAGAPFEIVLPLTITNGSISGGASNIIISAGSVESSSLTVNRTTGTTAAVTVDIGTLPGRPTGHGGYALVKSTGLPLEVFGSININNAPVFADGTSITHSVAENTATNVDIGDPVEAVDDDNDTLAYTLGGTDAASFDIDSTSGQLQTDAPLDYETKTSYTVTISVSDGRGGSDIITVTISVTDVDENRAPVFTEGEDTTRFIVENTETDQNIGIAVEAVDDDNDTLAYTLGGTDAASFDIDSTSGQLQTDAPLDYETKTSYTVTISVSDGRGGSDIITVTISVTGILPPSAPAPPLSDRTPQVRDAIVAAVPGVCNANDVTAAHLAAITSLSIYEENVTSLNSGDFDGLTGLTYLGLSYNPLSLLPSDIFDDLTALTVLDLPNNQLSSIPSLSGLTSLTDLYLNDNSFSSAPSLSGLFALEYLDLSNNSLTSISVSGLSSLTDLYLNDNSLTSFSFSGLSSLEDLDLSSNQLSSAPSVTGLSALRYLDLSSNQLSSAPSVTGLSALRRLNLSSNQLTSAPSFTGLSSLERLDLSSNQLSSAPSVTGLSALENLDLSSNQLTSFSFSSHSTLRRLYLNDNNLTSLSLSNLTSLHQVFAMNNSLSSFPSLSGLTSLFKLRLNGNTNSLSLNVSLEKVSSGQVKAVAPTGAPFDIVLPLSVTNGSISGGSSSITISQGSTESSSLTVNRTTGTTAAVTVDIGTLPGIYGPQSGYTLAKSGTLPLEVISAVAAAPAEVDNGNSQVPNATSVLPNYPNPSNPETWIPYQLAKPTKVTFTIYNTRGVVVRRLSLGHQLEGFYHNRSRAAHWDGKNESGESVASGIYFYTFTAGDFTATRKILIRK